MDFNETSQLDDIDQGALGMDGMSSGVTMATVTITPQDIQAMTESGAVTVHYEQENSQQVMSLYLQNDVTSDLQHITSLAEQQGISIMHETTHQDMAMRLDESGSEEEDDVMLKQEPLDTEDDTASLLAKLEANNTHKNNLVQLTSDGKIIKRLEMERVLQDESIDGNSTKAGPLLQQITLADGSAAYIHHNPADTMHAVRLADGTIAYVPAEMLQPAAITATVNLNLQPDDQHEDDDQDKDSTSSWISQLDKTEYGHGEGRTVVAPPNVTLTASNDRPQVTSAGGQKTIRVHLAEGEGRTLGVDDKVYKCFTQGCGKIYTSPHHLKVHQRQHTGDKPFVCDEISCQKGFATAYGLKSHKRIHTGEKPYMCGVDKCKKAFKTSGDLQKHTRTHTGEKPFLCPFEGCNKRFTTSNIRKVHIRVHTGERPYLCPVPECSKKFSSATNHKNHIRIHTGERPYVCTVEGCGKRFTEYSSLYKHHVVHTHTKPYVCSHCGKTYRQTSTLAMHKRQSHNDESPIPELVSYVINHGDPPLPDPKANYMPESELGEGALVINTSESQHGCELDHATHQNNDDDSQESTDSRVPSTSNTSSALSTANRNISIVVPAFQGGAEGSDQPMFVITDPTQTQAVLQQIVGQHVNIQQMGLSNLAVSSHTVKHTDTNAIQTQFD